MPAAEDLAARHDEPPVGLRGPGAPGVGDPRRARARSARPDLDAPWSAKADCVTRSAHRPPHHARSSGVAKHHTLADGVTSANPAACAHGQQATTRVRLAAVAPGDGVVELEPAVEAAGRPGYQVIAA